MKKADKGTIIDVLSEKIANSSNFYLADISDLNADATYKLRKACFEKKITLQVVKNSLLRKALEKSGKQVDELLPVLNHNTSVMFCASIKSKEELLGDIIGLLQSPIKNVISCLQSGQNNLTGLVKALEERAN